MPFAGSTYTLPAGANTAASGQVVASATWNAIHNDLATALNLVMTQAQRLIGVNFNAGNTDTAINIIFPPGLTRYRISGINISHASQTLTTATVGVFTAAGGAGTAIVTGGSAVTVNTASENTNNNMQGLTINNQSTQSYNLSQLFFRVGTAQGAAATGDVTFFFNFLP